MSTVRKYGCGAVYGRARVAVYERFRYACATCGKQFEPAADPRYAPIDPDFRDAQGRRKVCLLEVDHIIPRLRGGDNRPGNLQALCTQCNARKGAKVA